MSGVRRILRPPVYFVDHREVRNIFVSSQKNLPRAPGLRSLGSVCAVIALQDR